ncbi:MAG: metal-dependent hydrolase [bacterium]
MIISHLPAGYIIASVLERKYWKEFSRKEVLWLYAILFFFSIAPDFDLAYFWFINGMSSHRGFFTHSLFFYVILGVLVYMGFMRREKLKQRKIPLYPTLKKGETNRSNEQKKCSQERLARWVALSIIIGVLSHLMLDSILSCVGWLWPFYANPLGLPLINSYFAWIENYYFPLFVSVELGVAVLAIYTLTCAKVKTKLREEFFNALFIIFFLGAVFLPFAAKNLFYMPPDIGNRDMDKDGIRNEDDFDNNNDGIENFYDTDANGNRLNNKYEFIYEAKKRAGVLTWEGNKLLGSVFKLGLISEATLLRVSLEKAGIFLREEMNKDFAVNFEKYKDTAYNYNFSSTPSNIYNFFKNKNMLMCEKIKEDWNCTVEKGDIIFYGNNFNHFAIVVDGDASNYSVIEAGKYYKRTVILDKEDIEKIYGYPKAVIRLP